MWTHCCHLSDDDGGSRTPCSFSKVMGTDCGSSGFNIRGVCGLTTFIIGRSWLSTGGGACPLVVDVVG